MNLGKLSPDNGYRMGHRQRDIWERMISRVDRQDKLLALRTAQLQAVLLALAIAAIALGYLLIGGPA